MVAGMRAHLRERSMAKAAMNGMINNPSTSVGIQSWMAGIPETKMVAESLAEMQAGKSQPHDWMPLKK